MVLEESGLHLAAFISCTSRAEAHKDKDKDKDKAGGLKASSCSPSQLTIRLVNNIKSISCQHICILGCSELPFDPGWQDLLATRAWPRFDTR